MSQQSLRRESEDELVTVSKAVEEREKRKGRKKKRSSKKHSNEQGETHNVDEDEDVTGSRMSMQSSDKKKRGRKSTEETPSKTALDEENEQVDSMLADRERRRRKKRSKKGSQQSLRSSGGEETFADPALALAIRELQDDADDMASVSASAHDHDTLSTAGSRALAVPSPIRPVLPVSSHVDKVYTEKAGGGFINKRKGAANSIKLSSVNPALKEDDQELLKLQQTPLELGLESQKIFRSVGVFCHGFLAGLASWQLFMVYTLADAEDEPLDFVNLYAPLAQPFNFMFYLLTVICTISILDRYDFAQVHYLRPGAIAIVVYCATLLVTLTTTKLDDRISLHMVNSTWLDQLATKDLQYELSIWKSLNLCRSVCVIIGWLMVAMRPSTDLLSKHLRKLGVRKQQQWESSENGSSKT